MKKLTVMLMGLGIATASFPAIASAAPYTPMNQRVANLQVRIDKGVRTGALTRGEASRLRTDLRGLVGLEHRYRVSGGRLDMRERADLDRRFDRLSAKVRFDKHDRRYHR